MKIKKIYELKIIDRKTKEVVALETKKSQQAFDRLWCKALSNVNTLKYKMVASEIFDKLMGDKNVCDK